MFSTDQTHLRRYFATLGVAVAAGTLSLAGLFLKLQQDLLVTQSTLAKITPTARDALLRRQEYLSFGTFVLPWFVLVGFLGGIALSAYGLVGWAKRQRVIDEREDIGLHKERVELRQLNEKEKAAKLDRDAKESVPEASSTPTDTDAPVDRLANLHEVRTEISSVQQALVEKLRIFGSDQVVAPASINIPGKAIEVTAAVRQDYRPILFELRYVSELASVSSRTLDKLRRVAQAAIDANGAAVLIVIVSDFTTPMQIENWAEHVKQIVDAYHSVAGFYVGTYSDFIALSARDFMAEVGLGPTSTSRSRSYSTNDYSYGD